MALWGVDNALTEVVCKSEHHWAVLLCQVGSLTETWQFLIRIQHEM